VNRARGYIPLNGTAVVYGGKLRETSHARVRHAATSVGIRVCGSDSGAPCPGSADGGTAKRIMSA
jgi:hypothetical protein